MNNDGYSDWQLAVEFELETDPNSIQHTAQMVAQTIRELHIQAAIADRVQKTFLETLHGILRKEVDVRRDKPLIIRVLISSDTPGEGSDTISTSQNWGFFLVEKQRQRSGVLYHQLELYLYQETV